MEIKNQLVAVNTTCDKKNRFYNIKGMTQDQINEIKNRYSWPEWIVIFR